MTLGVRDFEPTRRDWQERLAGLRSERQAAKNYRHV
jgi:hypothetical protein